MNLPGWTSAQTTGSVSNIFFWISILALLLLGVAEVVSHYYGQRHDALIAAQRQADKDASDGEIARLHRETANAKLLTAQLWRAASGRRIQESVFLKALENKPKAVVEMFFAKNDADSNALAMQIESLLAQAKWELRGIPMAIPVSSKYPIPDALMIGGQASGVSIVTTSINDDLARPSTASAALTMAFAETLGGASRGRDEKMPEGLVRIVVSPKPPLDDPTPFMK